MTTNMITDLLDHALANDVFFTLAEDDTIAAAAGATRAILEYAPDALIGKPLAAIAHAEDATELADQLRAVHGDGEARRFSFRAVAADETWRMLDVVARRGPSGALVLHARDVTSWSHLEAVLVESRSAAYELAEAREQAVRQLRDLEASRAQLTAVLVHDLKSPLTTVLMNARFIQQDIDEREAAISEAKACERAADAIHRMIQDLLDVGTSDDGRLVALPAPLDLAEVLGELAEAQADAFAQRKLRLVSRVALDRPVAADRNLLGRALANVLDNCAKYAKPSTEVEVRAWIGLDRFECEGAVHVAVWDRGSVVPDAYKTKLFDLYARTGPDAKSYPRVSRGVGLAFARRALAAHGGEIWIEDHPDGGCVFRLCWPGATTDALNASTRAVDPDEPRRVS